MFPMNLQIFKVTCKEKRTSSIQEKLTPIDRWFINIAIVNKSQTLG